MSNNNYGNNSGTTSANVNGSRENEMLSGTSGNEKVDAKAGNDTVSGANGSDWVKGGSGDDRLVYSVGLNTDSIDYYDGGSGTNILVLQMSREEWMRDDIQADIAGYLAFLASTEAPANGRNNSAGYEFLSLGLTARRMHSLEVMVDGVSLDPRDEDIVANNVYETALTEHSIVTGNVIANDDVPDLVREVTLVAGPALGTLSLEADGSYSYDPGMDFDHLAEGESAKVEFSYQVTDADHDSATAVVVITVTGTNDAPIAVADTGSADENEALRVDVLGNDTDVDASDTHTVTAVSVASGLGSVAIVNNQVEWTPGSDYDYLAGDETAEVEIDYTMKDSAGAEASSTLSITVMGRNDAPTVASSLSATASEEDPVFTIDLLEGAADVDNGALLNVADFSVADNKGGWVLNGNQLSINPDFYDDLNTGDLETLDFTYKIIDGEGGEVEQTLQLNIEGFTDAPSLAASVSAGSAVNELRVRIASQPARDEKILLTFSNLPAGVKVLNAVGMDVTSGVNNFLGVQDFVVVAPEAVDADFDFGITVTGLNPDDSPIASTSGAIDFVYDHNLAVDRVIFQSEDQGIWASGDAPMIQWNEYVPIIGGKTKEWNETTKTWDDTGEGPWRSGEFSLVNVNVDVEQATSIALAGAQATLDAAEDTFKVASVAVDQAVINTYNLAVSAYSSAVTAANKAFNTTVSAALNVFNSAVDTISSATEEAAIAAYNAAVIAADAVRDTAIVTFGWLGSWVADSANAVYNSTVAAALAVKNAALSGAEDAAEAIQEAAQATYDAAVSAANWTKDRALEAANATFSAAKAVYEDAKQAVYDAAEIVFNAAQDAFDVAKNALATVQGTSKLEVNADLYGEVGVQVNFVLDSGSVDTEVQYDLASTLQHNRITDTMLITPHLVNQTTGDTVAFETISPNASLKAVLLYDVGAKLTVLLDSNLVVAGNVIWDITPGAGPITLSPQVSTGGWGDDLAKLSAEEIANVTDPDGVNIESFAEGEFVLIDLNTKDLGQVKVPIESFTEDILSLELGFPTVETQGTAADYDPSFYEEGGLVSVDISELTGSVMNLINARLDFSPELKALHPELGSLTESESFVDAIAKVGDALLSTLFDSLDGQQKRTPILLLDANDQTSSELLHLNVVPDDVIGDTLTADTAKIGFFTAYGESNDLVKVTIDIDQAVAVIVNKVVEAILAAASGGATVKPLQTLDDINPLDLSFGLEEILQVVEVPDTTIAEIKKYFDVSLGFESADIDVYSAYNFSQEFALSIDDVQYVATMEDDVQYFFAANDESGLLIENASQHDANGDGVVNYSISLAPEAMFSNDTEIGLTVGYVLNFLRASMKADLKLPLGDLLNIPALPSIPLNLINVNLGPLLRVQGDLDLASADIFESRFDIDIGTDSVAGSYEATDDEFVTLIGVMPVVPV